MSTTSNAASSLRALKRFRLYALNANVKYKRFAPPAAASTHQQTTTSTSETPSVFDSSTSPAPPHTASSPLQKQQEQQQPIEVFNPFLPWKNPRTGRWAPPQFSLRRQADLVKKARLLGSEALALLPPGPKTPRGPLLASLVTEHGLSLKVHESELEASGRTHVALASTSALTLSPKSRAGDTSPSVPDWQHPIAWTGSAFKPPRRSDGHEVLSGLLSRLYAGRRRMFKGHKWERTMEVRMKKRQEVLKAMKKTVKRYKSYTHRVKPNPLRPRGGKPQKLPF